MLTMTNGNDNNHDKTISTMTKWQWWLKRCHQCWHNDNDEPMMTKKMRKQQWRLQRQRGIIIVIIVIYSSSSFHFHCQRYLVVILSLSWKFCHHHLVIDNIGILSLCRYQNLIIIIMSSSSSCHHILCLSSCHCHLANVISFFFIVFCFSQFHHLSSSLRFLFIGH